MIYCFGQYNKYSKIDFSHALVETERGAVLALRPKCTSPCDGGVEKERRGEDDDDGRGVGCDDNDYDDDFCPCVVCL